MSRWAWVAIAVAVLVAVVLFVIPFPVHSQVASVTLDWTAPGDDGDVGTSATYEMRWSATQPDTLSATSMNAWWAAATTVSGLPSPQVSGTAQSVIVSPPSGFLTGTTYYFVMRARDEAGNLSAYSNVATKLVPDATPPRRIVDLRTR